MGAELGRALAYTGIAYIWVDEAGYLCLWRGAMEQVERLPRHEWERWVLDSDGGCIVHLRPRKSRGEAPDSPE